MFDRDKLLLRPLAEREHDLDVSVVTDLAALAAGELPPELLKMGRRLVRARNRGASSILMIGAHVIRSGVQRYIIDLMRRGLVTCLAMNGAGMIHDFELALIGATTESVSRYIKDGRFGLWRETGRINRLINEAYAADRSAGLGATLGRAIAEGDFPRQDISLLAAAARLGVPATVHVSIGCDIIHEHPDCDGAATGALSYNDFLTFAQAVAGLEGGVAMNFGSSVMAPEVYLKALAMARNVAAQAGQAIRQFSVLVCDLYPLPPTLGTLGEKDSHAYYFRPWKTMLVRTVQDGGQSFYVRDVHARTIPGLWTAAGLAEAAADCQ